MASGTSTTGLRADGPLRVMLGLLVAAATVLVALRGAPGAGGLPAGTWPTTLTTALTVLVGTGLAIAGVALHRRAAAVPGEPGVWTLLLPAAAVVGVSAVAAVVVEAVTADRPDRALAADVVFRVGCVLATAIVYAALNRWNRARLTDIELGESLNGLSAVLILVSLGNLVVPHLRTPAEGLGQWQFQVSLWSAGALVVVLGAAVVIAGIAGLAGDTRIWLVVGGLLAATAADVASVLNGSDGALLQAVWLLAAALLPVCLLFPPAAAALPGEAGANQAAISGALVIVFAGIALLAVDDDLAVRGTQLPTLFAVAGVVGAAVRVLRLVHDLTHLAETRREALTDELTAIPNRRALMAAIDDALLTAGSTSLMIIDLDRFKLINDRYGHKAGDEVLRHMADVFAGHLPDGAFLARLGGDEFAVLLVDAEPGVPTRVAESLAAAAAPLSDVKGRLLQVGASVGVVTVERSGELAHVDGGELLRRADAAMYQAKTSGSGVRRYDSAVDALAQDRLDLVEELHRALEGRPELEEVAAWFQPQLCAATGQVTGAEALVRWNHPRRGLLTPDAFIELAEQNELMMSLTARVMREAAGQAARWRAEGYRLRVSVNLSAGCLGEVALLALLDEVLGTGLPAADLVLEVTETSLMTDPERALDALHRIAGLGVGISIDDYGTGYSSLSYLNDLPATELKIDRSFTARTTSDRRTSAIVAGTVELAHRLGMRLIAEGVEDEQTLAAMTALGCDETQGYLHSRPLPPEAFFDWLRARPGPNLAPQAATEHLSRSATG